mgnify:CR=1 FL=1
MISLYFKKKSLLVRDKIGFWLSKKCFLYFYFVFCVFVVFKMPTLHSKINKSAKIFAYIKNIYYLCTANKKYICLINTPPINFNLLGKRSTIHGTFWAVEQRFVQVLVQAQDTTFWQWNHHASIQQRR